MGAIDGGEGGAEAEGAGGEEQVLDGGKDVGPGRGHGGDSGRVKGGHDEDGRLGEVVGEIVRRVVGSGDGGAGLGGLPERPVGGVPAVEVPLGDPGLRVGVADDDEVPGLAVAAAGRLDGGVEELPDELVGHGVGLETTHGALGVHGFEDVHRASFVASD